MPNFTHTLTLNVEMLCLLVLSIINLFGCTVFDCILLAARTGRTSPGGLRDLNFKVKKELLTWWRSVT